jgi:hypothetical protein
MSQPWTEPRIKVPEKHENEARLSPRHDQMISVMQIAMLNTMNCKSSEGEERDEASLSE